MFYKNVCYCINMGSTADVTIGYLLHPFVDTEKAGAASGCK